MKESIEEIIQLHLLIKVASFYMIFTILKKSDRHNTGGH